MVRSAEQITFGDIDEMEGNKKGEFGEAMAQIWIKKQIEDRPRLVFPETDPEKGDDIYFSHLNLTRCKYATVDESGVKKMTWKPDSNFTATHRRSGIKKDILIETKTAGGELTRDQEQVMGLVGTDEGRVVFQCNVRLNDEAASVDYRVVGNVS